MKDLVRGPFFMGARFWLETGDIVPGLLGGQRWLVILYHICYNQLYNSLNLGSSPKISKQKNNSTKKGSGAYGLINNVG